MPNNSDELLSPGDITPTSGQYEIVGPRGGQRDGLEVNSTKGHPMPPTSESGLKFKLVDETKHKKK